MKLAAVILTFCAALLGWCLSGAATEQALLIVQQPSVTTNAQSSDALDILYPPGARIVLAVPGGAPRSLTSSLVAAGDVIIAPDASKFVFTGKATRAASWQIYEFTLRDSALRQVTKMRGGAANAALLPNGDVVFSSPVPSLGKPQVPSSLYAQAPGRTPRRLTFGTTSATDPTVLRDGRILFVASRQDGARSLFTINSDGTELTTFALDHDGAPMVRKPRELNDGRIAFLSSVEGAHWRAESVLMARPFLSRRPLIEAPDRPVTSVEFAMNGPVICATEDSPNHEGGWRMIEAVPLEPRAKPIGHLSAMAPERNTGTLLCLNANFMRGRQKSPLAAAFVRILAATNGATRNLGVTPVHADGSFLVQVPADTPIGFETLDARGRALGRLEPFLWVRPGENRSCVGCHEPYNRSPRNTRPIAANLPAVAPIPAASISELSATSGASTSQ